MSVTTVALGLDRPKQGPRRPSSPAVRVKSVGRAASYDNGKSWQAVKVTSSNGHWSAAVPNRRPVRSPAGDRRQCTGDSSVITVYKAYAIG